MKNLVSIIIPVFNGEDYIKATLESCLSQTYVEIEIVIINDGSTDHTEMIVFETFKQYQGKIKYFKQDNQGLCRARNKGIAIANGNYILFLDADDLLLPHSIELLITHISHFDVVFGSWQDFDSQTNGILNEILYHDKVNDNIPASYFKIKPTVSTALLRKNSLVKWDESLKTWDVTQYFLDILINYGKFKFINHAVTRIRQHDNPSRLSIQNDHFEPVYSSVFFANCKMKLKNAGLLDPKTEMIIDQEIISYIYIAYNRHNKRICNDTFKTVNLSLIQEYDDINKFGLHNFIRIFNGLTGLIIFKLLNKVLHRV